MNEPIDRLREICLALPAAYEKLSHGEPSFFVRNRMFATYASAGTHHGRSRNAVWCKAAPGHQLLLVTAAPERFFVPPYVGPSGWVGIWLDRRVSWKRVATVVGDGYRAVAPAKFRLKVDE